MGRYDILRQIEQLGPERDHVRIYYLSTGCDFSWDTTRALELALYRTYCVPSISKLLDKTGEFTRHPQKRYDDTSIIVAEISEYGYDSERGRAALRRMNSIHRRFDISNDDFLYVLSTFVFVPVRWMQNFGWRRYSDHERLATFYFWREVGKRMGIKDIPETYEEFEHFSQEYERKYFTYHESNARIGAATRDLFASWFPKFLTPVVRRSIHALLDDALITAFGFPRAGNFLRWLMASSLRLRGRLLRLLPPRRKAHFITHDPIRSYPHGYSVEKLGPEENTPQNISATG
jgi:hypothetical protein